ncbi:MAG: TlyA family RNA methyltransferase [Maricaulaceae bacterium]
MRADVFLTERGYYESRSRAQAAIKAGRVKIGGVRIKKAGEKVDPEAEVDAKLAHPYASRGGLKLAHALTHFKIDATDAICLDVGASTGGFTDVLLKNGAAHVYAVDVGHGQLHSSLQNRDDVTSMEKTDARDLTPAHFKPLPNFIVCDASFISLAKLLAPSLAMVKTGTKLVTLVKPQFEVGKAGIGRGGIVKSKGDALLALSDVAAWITAQGWHVVDTTDSPIKGGSGNREFLLYAVKQ